MTPRCTRTGPEPFAFARTINASDIFPSPRHLLEDLYHTDKEAMQNHPWFADGFVGLGPYQLVKWERGGFMEFVARDNYPLGTPKIGRLILRFIPDANAAFTNLLSGVVDLEPLSAITVEQGVSARDQWEAPGRARCTSPRPACSESICSIATLSSPMSACDKRSSTGWTERRSPTPSCMAWWR